MEYDKLFQIGRERGYDNDDVRRWVDYILEHGLPDLKTGFDVDSEVVETEVDCNKARVPEFTQRDLNRSNKIPESLKKSAEGAARIRKGPNEIAGHRMQLVRQEDDERMARTCMQLDKRRAPICTPQSDSAASMASLQAHRQMQPLRRVRRS